MILRPRAWVRTARFFRDRIGFRYAVAVLSASVLLRDVVPADAFLDCAVEVGNEADPELLGGTLNALLSGLWTCSVTFTAPTLLWYWSFSRSLASARRKNGSTCS